MTDVTTHEPPEDGVALDAHDADTRDYVTFALGEEVLAFPMDRVQEIIRMPETVEVPLAPPSLVGLANLRSRVLPVVSLRSCCGHAPREADEATRVVVVDCGAALGFVVDRVAAVVSVEPEQVEDAEQVQGTVQAAMLAGVIKDGERMITVLDVERIVDQEFAVLAERAAASSAAALAATGGPVPGGEDEGEGDDDTFEMVSFTVEDQEYALPIDDIQEIVQVPEAVNGVPNADPRVLGIMDLRGRLLPLVSLRRVFGTVQGELDESCRIVVVPVDEDEAGGGRAAVGVVMDTVREVLRVPNDLVDPLPGYVAPDGAQSEVESVCRLDEGRRLVSVLSAERLLGTRGLRAAVEAAREAGDTEPEEAHDVAEHDAEEVWSDDEQQLVVFRVAGEEYCLSVDAVQEIIRVPEELVSVPRSLSFVEGLVNLRGTVLPVVDLRRRLGMHAEDRDDRQRIVVLDLAGTRTGFIVDSVAEVLKLVAGDIEQAPELSNEQAELITQVVNLRERMLLILDTDVLVTGEERTQLRDLDEVA